MTWQRHQQNAQPQTGCAVSIQYHHWDSRHNRIPTESCQVLHIMTKEQHVETQVALANGQSPRLQTSTFSLLCMPNTDPIRCDSGWFPKSLLTYPTLNLRSPPSCLIGIGAGWLKGGRANRDAIIEQCDAYLRLHRECKTLEEKGLSSKLQLLFTMIREQSYLISSASIGSIG